jgi:hypothetical protein
MSGKKPSAGLIFTVGEIIVPLKATSSGRASQSLAGIVAAGNLIVKEVFSPLSDQFSVKFFPNPFMAEVSADIQYGTLKDAPLRWRAFDITGKEIGSAGFQAGTSRIDISTDSWIPGLYILAIQDGNGKLLSSSQIIKQ